MGALLFILALVALVAGAIWWVASRSAWSKRQPGPWGGDLRPAPVDLRAAAGAVNALAQARADLEGTREARNEVLSVQAQLHAIRDKIEAQEGEFAAKRSYVSLARDGEYEFEVVGESYRQDELASLCGPRKEGGEHITCVAMLDPQRDNPHDRNAVAVYIGGKHVAFLARECARDYRDQMTALGHRGERATCYALICGGWDGHKTASGWREQGSYGVKLDITLAG
jgi:hypothetical protein